MSRSPTRTPPIRINPTFLSAVAALDDGAAAAIMRIAAHHAEAGRPMSVAEFGARMGQDGLFLHAMLQGMSHLLDADALSAGSLVVDEIARGLEHRADIMSKRSEAAHTRYVRAAADQKAKGAPVKLTKGRVASSRKGAAAVGMEDASDPAICTHVHKTADYAHLPDADACTRVHKGPDYAHMHPDDGCTHVHSPGTDAHMYIEDDPASVHKTALDAHMCINDARDSDDAYAHVCIDGEDGSVKSLGNKDFFEVDRSDDPSHVRVRPPRADLSISNLTSSKKNKRVESTRTYGRVNEAVETPARLSDHSWAPAPRQAVATSNHDHDGNDIHHEERVMSTPSGYRPSAGSAPVEVPAEFVRRLLDAGPVDADAARAKLAGWIAQWGLTFVRSGVEAIPDKDIARPLSYLGSILTNLAKETGSAPAPRKTAGGRPGAPQEAVAAGGGMQMPLRIKRRVSVPPGVEWQLLGWTAKGREGDAPGRRQVWRTESGDLRYLPAPASEEIPTYEEDPGVYAYD